MASISVLKKENIQYAPNIDRMIKEAECKEITTLANSTRWHMEKDGTFPKRVKVGVKAVAYRLSEVQAWVRGEWHPGWKPAEPKQ